MKALKLILLFLVILGAVVGIFYLVTLPPKIVELPPIDDETREEYRQKFEYEWQGAGDWDENIFMQHLEELNQLSADYSVEDLRTFDRRTITEIISQKIFGEWEKGDCKKAEIDKYIKAVDIICNNYSDAKTDPDIKLIKEVNATYRAALKLADKKIGLAPTFNGTKWNSYTDYSNSIKKEKKNIEDNNLYNKYLKNIAHISNRLGKIDAELKSGRTSFYNTLANKIYNYYNKIARDKRTQDQLVNLRKARDNYGKEYASNSKINTLAKTFAADVDANETRAAQEAQQGYNDF